MLNYTIHNFCLRKNSSFFQGRISNTKFIIVGASRTGSTMLRMMLNSHPQICSHGEIFAKPMRGFVGVDHRTESPIKQWLLNLRDRDQLLFFKNFVFLKNTETAVGFKILYRTLNEIRWRPLINHIIASTDIKIIHITRRNRLKRLVSQKIARSTGVFVLIDENNMQKAPQITLTLPEIIEDFYEIENDEINIRKFFRSHKVIEVIYEDIVENKNNIINLIQMFINVNPIELKSPTIKLASENLSESIENFEDLKARIRNSNYASYLEYLN